MQNKYSLVSNNVVVVEIQSDKVGGFSNLYMFLHAKIVGVIIW